LSVNLKAGTAVEAINFFGHAKTAYSFGALDAVVHFVQDIGS